MKNLGITVVSPMWGERKITDRMVFSVLHQYISESNPFKIHLVLVDDYIERRGENDKSYYEYYTSDAFKDFYDHEKIKITIIKNEKHEYQGHSREIGYMAGDYPFFLLIDCDDMLAANACDRYLNIIASEAAKNESKPISCIQGMLYSFDTCGYENNINGNSIWVQSRCYNRDFLIKHDIHFPTGLNSKQGEDYPFIRKLDYAIAHDNEYNCMAMPFENHESHFQCTAYWFPNANSLSRQDPHYSQHLAGWTMASSNSILNFFDQFNKKNGFEDAEDEYMKHEYLNMTIYAFYNLLDFIKEVSSTDYKPLEEDWYALRDNVKQLRERLKHKYWSEIIYSDVEDTLYQVKHFSDCRFTESWIGTFYDFMNSNHIQILEMSYSDMLKYAHSLTFDAAGHEIGAPYVKAWLSRHNNDR